MSLYSESMLLLDGVSVTTISSSVPVGSKKNFSLQLFSSNMVLGDSGTYSVEVSNDGLNWTTYNRLVSNTTNTNVQGDTRVASIVFVNANDNDFLFFPSDDHFDYMRVTVTVAGGSEAEYSAKLSYQSEF